MSRRRSITYWNVPVPRSLNEALEKALEIDTHISKADFIRDAVRRELERMGLYPIRRGETQDDAA